MRHISWFAVLLVSLCGSAAAQDSVRGASIYSGDKPMQSQPQGETQGVREVIWQFELSYVRLAESQSGAPLNQHPYPLSDNQLQEILKYLMVKHAGQKKAERIFSDGEIDTLAPRLSNAFALVSPNEDVAFQITGRRTGVRMVLGPSLTNGRIFFTNGRLNFLFGTIHGDYFDSYKGAGLIPTFRQPERMGPAATEWRVSEDEYTIHAAADRSDWVSVDPVSWGHVTSRGGRGVPAGTGVPTAVVQPAPERGQTPVAPAPVVGAVPTQQDVVSRFRTLKELREQGLISDEEYNEKRRALLDEL